MELILYDINKSLCDEFTKYFSKYENVKIINCSFLELPQIDCIVSPANSFGIMDGGIDLVFTNYFGTQLMKRVQNKIIKEYSGEQPVGTSFIIETNDPTDKHLYLAHTPTMVLPMDIRGTNNVYYAMKSMLSAAENYPSWLSSIACCGLGTATGKVPFDIAAKQMALAYEHFINPTTKIDWTSANQRYREVRS